MARYNALVWATARSHRLADADAADVVQTTWLRLVEHLDDIQNPDRLGAWMATTARREALRLISSGRRVTPTDQLEEIPDLEGSPSERLEVEQRDVALRRALSGLGERCQRLLRLLTAEPALSYEEISAVMDMPVGSIGPTRGRCLASLRVRLEIRGITGTP